MSRVGFTTTIPVEVIFAAGLEPCDLNNIFVSDANPVRLVERAEKEGFPKNMCAWIKGIYGAVLEGQIDTVVIVLEGDCSNTRALGEILQYRGVRTIPFSYPYDRDAMSLSREIEKFMAAFGVDAGSLERTEERIEAVREKLRTVDRLTWQEGQVSGWENHYWLVSSSDMLGNYEEFEKKLDGFIEEARARKPANLLPLGYAGVPPITPGLYDLIERLGGRVVFNETQRQFSLPHPSLSIVERYLHYTYPYGIFARTEDIRRELEVRKAEGLVHYVQSFCYRIVEDMILKEYVPVPVLTIEGDLPRTLDTRTTMRIEAFMEMLRGKGHGEK